MRKVLPLIHKALKNNNKVVVICEKGLSRSPAIVAGYLLKYRNFSFENVMEIYEKIIPEIDINLSFFC